MKLSDTQKTFVLHWGEKAMKFGFNRTLAQIHALLYVSPEALDAEEIAETLQISRSNVSISIRELQSWGLITAAPKMGDRKTYYETLDSTWEMFRLVAIERQKRELAPSISLLRDLLLAGNDDADPTQRHVTRRLESLLQLFEHASTLSELLKNLSVDQVAKLLESNFSLLEQAVQPEEAAPPARVLHPEEN
ncbi:MAG: MarR family transcriptional regulator [Candidatus Hydrogenedens sp.]|nr:MarR family transcriptional regulator [Candidatus Hydrogenedens sp.]